MGVERLTGRRRDRFVAGLRREGLVEDDAMAAAFAAVPREAFLVDGFRTAGGRWVTPDDGDFLDEVYRNDALVTKVRDGVPVSSSSQPSLMAFMLQALDVRPGSRVLEVGAGTGYNAALLATLGARVTSVDVQPDVVRRASAALRRAGTAGVDVLATDGYDGYPENGPYDRVIVTVGVNGVSPAWLDQLAPGGFLLAPVYHAGTHPVLRVHAEPGGGVGGRGICGAGFMSAAGPLGAPYPGMHPPPLRGAPLRAPAVRRPARWRPPLDARRYHDLAVAAGAWDRRVTHGAMDGVPAADWVLLDGEGGGAAVAPDGTVGARGSQAAECADAAAALLDRWERAGAPMVEDWWVSFATTGEPARPIWAPERWTL